MSSTPQFPREPGSNEVDAIAARASLICGRSSWSSSSADRSRRR